MKGFLIGLLAVLCVGSYAQSVPDLMNYQGRLTKADGTPVPDAAYRVRFAIYRSSSGGDPVWLQTVDPLYVRNGVFAVLLGGPQNPLTSSVFDGAAWLEIQVGNDPPLAPRQQIASVAYAFQAETAGNGVPVGGVIPWWGDAASPPPGWKVCDGTVISDSRSPLNGLTVPDLRDRFVRGAVGNVRPNAPFGGSDTQMLTVAQMPAHNHRIYDPGHSHGINDPGHQHMTQQMGWNAGPPDNSRPRVDANSPAHVWSLWVNPSHTGISILPSGTGIGIETAGGGQPFDTVPRYVGLVYIMRVR